MMEADLNLDDSIRIGEFQPGNLASKEAILIQAFASDPLLPEDHKPKLPEERKYKFSKFIFL